MNEQRPPEVAVVGGGINDLLPRPSELCLNDRYDGLELQILLLLVGFANALQRFDPLTQRMV